MKKISRILFLAAALIFFGSQFANVSLAATYHLKCNDGFERDYDSTTDPKSYCTGNDGLNCVSAGRDDGGNWLPCAPRSLAGVLSIVDKVFGVLFVLFMAAGSFVFLYAAFLYIMSEGEQEKIREAKRMIIYAFIGLIVAAFAFGAPYAIQGFL